jgi:hypothetical protein
MVLLVAVTTAVTRAWLLCIGLAWFVTDSIQTAQLWWVSSGMRTAAFGLPQPVTGSQPGPAE